MTVLVADQGVAACAFYAGPRAQWVRFGGLFVVVCLAVVGFAAGAAAERAGWGRAVAVAILAGVAAVGAIDWRMADLERAVAGLCTRAPLMLDARG